MKRISYTASSGDLGWFDLEKAALVAADVTEWDGQNRISRATGSGWVREDLYLTAGGVWLLQRENRDGRGGAVVGISWQGLPPDEAEEWLRRQDLHDIADERFTPVEERIPVGLQHPQLQILDAGSEPVITFALPRRTASALVEAVRRYVPAGTGIDGAVVDELSGQLFAQREGG